MSLRYGGQPSSYWLSSKEEIIAWVVWHVVCFVSGVLWLGNNKESCILEIWAHSLSRSAHTHAAHLAACQVSLLDTIDSFSASQTLFLFFCYRTVEIDLLVTVVATKKRDERNVRPSWQTRCDWMLPSLPSSLALISCRNMHKQSA
jgi:hypothetical protein